MVNNRNIKSLPSNTLLNSSKQSFTVDCGKYEKQVTFFYVFKHYCKQVECGTHLLEAPKFERKNAVF